MRREDDQILQVQLEDWELIWRMRLEAEEKLVRCEMERDRWKRRYETACDGWILTGVLLACVMVGNLIWWGIR